MKYSIYHNLNIKAPIEKVYRAVSEPAHLTNWWPDRCSGIPRAGESYNLYFTPEYDWYGEVVQADEPTSFRIKMTQSDADWNPTSFGFDLTRLPESTLVEFSHSDWNECNAHFKQASYCWALLLNGLKKYIEDGAIIPFEQRS